MLSRADRPASTHIALSLETNKMGRLWTLARASKKAVEEDAEVKCLINS